MTRALLLGLVLLAPLAGAHAVPADLTVAPFVGALPYDGESRTTVRFEYRCSGMSTEPTDPDMHVAFAVASAPSWAELRVEPTELALEPCVGIRVANATLSGTARADAAATPGDAIVEVAWTTAGMTLRETASVTVRAPYVAAIRVDAPVTHVEAKPQSVAVFPLTIHNAGNGLVKVAFELVSKPESLQVPLPVPITLQGPEGAIRSGSVPVTVQTPYRNGNLDENGTLVLRLTPFDPLDPTQRGEPQEVSFSVRTKGFYAPGLQHLGVVAALALAAVFSRRRGS